MVGAYTIRYRSTKELSMPALVVEDQVGTAFLFLADRLQVQVGGEHASERLVGLLGGQETWEEVPRVRPYSLEDLGSLLTGRMAPRRREGRY